MGLTQEQRMQRWEITRRKGRGRFILVWGVLAWGIGTGITSSLMIYLFMNYLRPGLFKVSSLFPLAVACLVGGIFWGYFMWRIAEKAFLAHHEEGPF